MMGAAKATSLHEARHILGSAIAIELVAPQHYGIATVSWSVKGAYGSTSTEIGDVTKAPLRKLSERVASLDAAAPCAALGTDGVLEFMRHDRWTQMFEEAGLSGADLDLLAKSKDRPATHHAKVILGTIDLEQRLGATGLKDFAHAIWSGSNQHLSTDWKLSDLVSQDRAKAALAAASKLLAKVMAS